jgi:ubiquinone/menaquinone biosynthesis C-methylase UbiE
VRSGATEAYALSQSAARVASTLQSAYDEQYSDAMTEWREIGGKHKAANILQVCKGRQFDTVIEVGAGEGSILKFLDASAAFAELHAVEISDSGIGQIRKRGLRRLKEVKKFDGYEIPYPDKAFDLAYCSHVIEHVEHPRILLREIKRISEFAVFEIPLDYSVDVHRKTETFLSYGHINIFTPSTFKFLLKSEGYEIVNESFTHTHKDVTRFNWYRNMKLQKTLGRELLLNLSPLRHYLKRLRLGRERYREFGYSAYTCLARNIGELKIF